MKFQLATLALVLAGAALPAAATAQSEPNDTFASANGPLVSDVTYTSVLETENDADYYAFYVDDRRQLHITAQTLTGSSSRTEVCVSLFEDGDDYSTVSACPEFGDAPETIDYSVDRGKYYIVVEGNIYANQASYAFSISAPGGLVSAECLAAQDAVARYTKELDVANSRLARTKSKIRRKRIQGTIKNVKFALFAASNTQATTCPA